MSAFAVTFDPSNMLLDNAPLERVMERLRHRGPDGRDVLCLGNVSMGHWHFWTTPEEVNERQPLRIPTLPFTLVWDGRLDNRSELFAKLSFSPVEGRLLSDAALVLHAYDRWGEQCVEHFIGEFAFALFDEQRAALFCARDPLGDRTLFYAMYGTCLVVASEPWAVAGASTAPVALNETALALSFAVQVTGDGQTLFKNVYELLPAHTMTVTSSSQQRRCYWKPDLSVKVRGRSDEEYAEEFRSLLEQSISSRLRSPTPAGILMSGGLDSTSVACLAARMLAPQPLTTFSYVFDELEDCDERRYIEAVKTQWGIHSIQIPCDDAWPLKDWQNWPLNPNQPEGNPYRLLKERAYRRTHDEGIRVLLTGGFGDHLYSTGPDCLADLLLEGKFLNAIQELYFNIQLWGLRKTFRAGFVQRAGRRLMNNIPRGMPATPGWLTEFSTGHLTTGGRGSSLMRGPYENLLGRRAAFSASSEIFHANRHNIELRHPFRDRRLIEFVLKLPAYQLYYQGRYKHILRVALRGILPELIRNRMDPTSIASLLLRGFEHEKTMLEENLQDPAAFWRKFVRIEWLLDDQKSQVMLNHKGLEALVPWVCIASEAWQKSFVLSSASIGD